MASEQRRARWRWWQLVSVTGRVRQRVNSCGVVTIQALHWHGGMPAQAQTKTAATNGTDAARDAATKPPPQRSGVHCKSQRSARGGPERGCWSHSACWGEIDATLMGNYMQRAAYVLLFLLLACSHTCDCDFPSRRSLALAHLIKGGRTAFTLDKGLTL